MNKKMRAVPYAAAFIVPIGIMMILLIMVGIFPFGDRSILSKDLDNQYISFFGYIKEIAKDPTSIFYSFSKNIGGEMVGLTAYYLMSPLNILYLFVSNSQLPNMVVVVTLCKIGLAGLSFFFVFRKKSQSKLLLLFSTAYALMSYNIIYSSNIMWLDGVILLPLIILGIDRIGEGKKPWLYLGSLFYALILNYYIGYMLCIFSVIYFIFYILFGADWKKDKIRKVFINYTCSSALAGGLAAILLIPVKYALEGSKEMMPLNNFRGESNFSLLEFFSKYVIGSFGAEEMADGAPNIYCGIFVLFFVGIYFISKRYKRREKVGAIFILLFLLFSMKSSGLNFIWHGFAKPNWFPYRYSFIFSFFLLMLAVKGAFVIKDIEKKKAEIALLSVFSAYLFIIFALQGKYDRYLSTDKWIVSIVVALACVGLLISGIRRGQLSIRILMLTACIELGWNGFYDMQELCYMNMKNYCEFITTTENAVSYVKKLDSDFYRMEKTFERTKNDPMMFGYHGVSHYSSSDKQEIKNFVGNLGFRDYKIWSYYHTGTTYANDSFLGIKYVLTKDRLGTGYEYIDRIDGIRIYRNNNTLPIGFCAGDDVVSENLEKDNWLGGQNHLWQLLTGNSETKVFERIHNVREQEHKVKQTRDMQGNHIYEKTSDGRNSYVEYQFVAEDENPLYAYFIADEPQPVSIYVNGKEIGDYFTTNDYQILRLGQFRSGEEVRVRLYLNTDYVKIKSAVFFAQNMNVFFQCYEELNSQALNLKKKSSICLEGKITSKGDKKYCLLTIPYDEAWRISVDGKRVKADKALGALMAFTIDSGEHDVKLEYFPKGLQFGGIISLLSLVALMGWIWKVRKKPA